MSYETASDYVPAGASFDGPGAVGIVALIEAADAAGANWTDATDGLTYEQVEAAVHHRTVDGETVWGLALSVLR